MALRCSLGFIAALTVTHGIFLALAGYAFIDQVYLFHLAKPPRSISGWSKLLVFLRECMPLLIMCLAGGIATAAKAPHRQSLVAAALAGLAGHALVMATRPTVLFFYFHPMLFPMRAGR